MADGVTIDIDTSGLLRLLEQLPATIEPILKEVAKETAQRVATEARRRVPVRSGRLRNSIQVRESYDRKGYVVGTFLQPKVGISVHTMKRSGRKHTQRVTQDNLPIWVEHGTFRMNAHPFLDPAAKLEEQGHLRRMSEALEDELKGLGE